ncbi:hypothetical protein [Scytonema millei]|nr:hypothetical protein [Scytonema millei]
MTSNFSSTPQLPIAPSALFPPHPTPYILHPTPHTPHPTPFLH